MLQLIDGPCKAVYLVKHAPLFLRAVRNESGVLDVLDQAEDTPKKNEKVYVYQREGDAGWIHIYMSPRSKSGFYAMAKYLYLPDVDGETLRDNEVWHEWA